MDKRTLGITIVVLSLVLGGTVLSLIGDSQQEAEEQGCYQNAECSTVASTLNMSHLGIGLLFALFSLGVYLLTFGRTEEKLLQQLEHQKSQLTREEKLKIVTLLLSPNEKKVFDVVAEQEGISQNMLTIKAGLSKATISQILTNFEKKNIIAREVLGKTYKVYLRNVF